MCQLKDTGDYVNNTSNTDFMFQMCKNYLVLQFLQLVYQIFLKVQRIVGAIFLVKKPKR